MSTSEQTVDAQALVDSKLRFTGTQINYYLICKRKLWLFSHNLELEPESDLVRLGRLLHEHAYKRRFKEVQVDRIKVDFMERHRIERVDVEPVAPPTEALRHLPSTPPVPAQDTSAVPSGTEEPTPAPRGGPAHELVIHEVKRSKKLQEAHLFQLLYYIYFLRQTYGVNVAHGVLHYPLLRQNVQVDLTPEKEREVKEALEGIRHIIAQPVPPEPVWKAYCRSCAYRELCWG
jgi:CRISPR-associated exonuclease Cas4